MSARKTGYRAIHVSAGIFPTYEAAVKAANALKIQIGRLSARKGYTCSAIIGISENNPHTGEVTTAKTGKRGRPRKVFVRTNGTMQPVKTEPHLHIVIRAEPAETLAKEVASYLNRTYGKGKRVAWVKNCGGYVEAVTHYIIKQSLKIRTINCKDKDFCNNISTTSFLFTPTPAETTSQTVEESMAFPVQKEITQLSYNNKRISNYFSYNFAKSPYIAHFSSFHVLSYLFRRVDNSLQFYLILALPP